MTYQPFQSQTGRLQNLQPLTSLLVHLEDTSLEKEQEELRKNANHQYQFLYWQ